MILSLTTRVPPVTDEKSPPASLITGADSPVMADSSTDAIPSITTPSFGISSPVFTITISPFFREPASTFSILLSSFKRLADVSFLVFFKLSACAFPLPSAIDSAKFANITVIKRINEIIPLNTLKSASFSVNNVGLTVKINVRKKPISTTNITGFLIKILGLNFLKESIKALFIISLEKDLICFLLIVNYPQMLKCSAIGPKAKAGKNVRAPIIKIIKNKIKEKVRLSVLNVDALTGTGCFL